MEIKYGDKFKLGDHYLINGDATDPKIINKLMGGNKVKVILSDIPYGISVSESKKSFIKTATEHKDIINDHFQSDEEYKKFNVAWLDAIKPHLETKNSCYIFNSDRMVFSLREAMIETGFKLSELLIWVKSNPVIGRLDYLPQHELVCYGWYGRHEFLKSKDKSVLFYPKPNKSNLHPTMKPVGLIRNLILNSSRVGDIIHDGFLGSGTTLLAAEQTKRICYGCELDSEYCQIIIDRFEKLTKIKAIKVEEVNV